MSEFPKTIPIETVAELRMWIEPLRDDQRIKIDIELLPDLDLKGCAMHQLASFVKDGGSYEWAAKKEWHGRYGFDFPQYARDKHHEL